MICTRFCFAPFCCYHKFEECCARSRFRGQGQVITSRRQCRKQLFSLPLIPPSGTTQHNTTKFMVDPCDVSPRKSCDYYIDLRYVILQDMFGIIMYRTTMTLSKGISSLCAACSWCISSSGYSWSGPWTLKHKHTYHLALALLDIEV